MIHNIKQLAGGIVTGFVPHFAVLSVLASNFACSADHHTDATLGMVAPLSWVDAVATPPGVAISGRVTSFGNWPWVRLFFTDYRAQIPGSYAGGHVSTFAGNYIVDGNGESNGGALTWDMTATGDTGEWLADQPIQSLGEVTKTSPTGEYSNNLHYAGTGGPEIASFSIETSSATDKDKHSRTGETRDAGLDASSTEWKVPAGTGTITQGAFTAVFTPSSEVRQNITVDAIVHEGLSLSHADENYDETITKRWSETLTTFKIGVTMNPGNRTIWEDHANDFISAPLGSASMEARIGWTYLLGAPGTITGGGEMPLKSATWKAIAATSSGQVTGIRRSIKYRPSIVAQGQYHFFVVGGGALPPGSGAGAAAVVRWLGRVSTYVEAGIDIVTAAAGSLQASVIVAGNSVIENEAVREIGEQVYLEDRGPKDVDFSGLSIDGALVRAGPGDLIHGSITMKGVASVTDLSRISQAFALLRQNLQARALIKCTKPVYGD